MSKLNLNGDQYMKLLLTQMKNQNPMDPMDNGKMLSQVSQLATLESTNSLKNGFQDVLKLVNVTGGANLVGRDITYRDGNGTASGTVDAIKTIDGKLRVECGDQSLSLSDIVSVL